MRRLHDPTVGPGCHEGWHQAWGNLRTEDASNWFQTPKMEKKQLRTTVLIWWRMDSSLSKKTPRSRTTLTGFITSAPMYKFKSRSAIFFRLVFDPNKPVLFLLVSVEIVAICTIPELLRCNFEVSLWCRECQELSSVQSSECRTSAYMWWFRQYYQRVLPNLRCKRRFFAFGHKCRQGRIYHGGAPVPHQNRGPHQKDKKVMFILWTRYFFVLILNGIQIQANMFNILRHI